MTETNLIEKEVEAEKNEKVDKAVVAQLEELTAEEVANLPMLQEMIKAGVIYGRKKSKMNPKMKPYIYTFRAGVALFDLLKTLEGIEKAAAFLKEKMDTGGKVLFVATQPSAKDLAKKLAEDLGQFYVVERWLGGMLTNYKTISSRIERFKTLKAGRAANKFDKHTKKERLLIDREIARLERYLESLSGMAKLPAAVVVIDPQQEMIVVREARQMKIPVIALIGSDCDIAGITYPVVANDASIQSIKFFTEQLAEAYSAGQKLAQVAAPAAVSATV